MWDLPCTVVVHQYMRRWINWSRSAEIQAERAIQRKQASRQRMRGGNMSRSQRRSR